MGVRIYDGNGNVLISDFIDPYEQTLGYTTAQWRTAQFEVGKLDLSQFSFTPSGYLLISPERNSTEAYQEKELTMYVDDVKLISLSTGLSGVRQTSEGISAFWDPASGHIFVNRIPSNTRTISLCDITGRVLQEVQVAGDKAVFDVTGKAPQVFIVRAVSSGGMAASVKVINYQPK